MAVHWLGKSATRVRPPFPAHGECMVKARRKKYLKDFKKAMERMKKTDEGEVGGAMFG